MKVSHLLPPSSEFHRTNISGLHCRCAQRTSNLSLVPSTFKASCHPQGIHARVLWDGKDVENTSAVLQRRSFGGKCKQTWRAMEGISTVLCPRDSSVRDNGATLICHMPSMNHSSSRNTKGKKRHMVCYHWTIHKPLDIKHQTLWSNIQYRARYIFFVQSRFCLVCWEHV